MSKLTITPATLTLDVGETAQLVAAPANVTWSSANAAIATVTNKGLVTAMAVGVTTITAKKKSGKPETATVPTTVEDAHVDVEPPEPEEPPVDPPDPEPPDPVPPGDRAMLTAADLTFEGQQYIDHNYANLAFAFRYVNGERRFLVYEFSGSASERVADLVEYRQNPAGLKNGDAHWTISTVPMMQEVRRWKDWSTKERIGAASHYPPVLHADAGNGAWPASFYWDESKNLLWYTWQPIYQGGGMCWPAYSAVCLVDAEAIVAGDAATASRVVSEGNRLGPYYFKDAASSTAWKSAAASLMPIPPERRAEMRASFLNAGHHGANIGQNGPRSLSLWRHGDMPTPGAPDSTIHTDAELVWNTGVDSGATPPQMRIPNIQYQAAYHASPGHVWTEDGETHAQTYVGDGYLPLAKDSLIYQHEYGDADCLTIFMYEGAGSAGGAWVPEVFAVNGGWIVPPGWKMAAGDQQLSAPENVFYWPKVALGDTAPILGKDPGKWVRLRQTGTGTIAGHFKAGILSESLPYPGAYENRPGDPTGSHAMLGQEQYDASHYGTCYEETFWGGAWVRTAAVEGLVYFGPLKTGGQWYGGAPAWIQPIGGGVAQRHTHFNAAESFTNGGKSEGPMYPFCWTFDVQKVMACANGTRPITADGLQPEAFWKMPEQWPGIIWYQTVPNPDSPYYQRPMFATYGTGSSVVYDPVTQELILWLSNAAVWSGLGIVLFFKVRS